MNAPLSTWIALVLAFASPAWAAPAERIDALDFDNGAFLLEQSESYANGIENWSPWHLTDGSDETGWCSAEGQPKGESYVWELDTTWRLDTLALSTKNVQEDGYPGISAKTVELLVAPATGPWKSLGQFGVGKLERREHALPKGTQAARVKVVIVDNHGNAKFTELAEVDLFGERVAPSTGRRIDGDYATNYGPMRFVQEGDAVFGCYDWTAGSLIWGTVTGRVAQVTWFEPRKDTPAQGTATFSVASAGNHIWGVWYRDGQLAGEWSGARVPASEGPACTPAKKGQLARGLERTGRVVLYGIRFDTASAVPRPESQTTLEELFATLDAQKTLRVTVEGHTDATATDAYNLDLSNRRARSIVAWLVKRGVAADRLVAKGLGRTQPVADNGTAQGRALNRRVEVSVTR